VHETAPRSSWPTRQPASLVFVLTLRRALTVVASIGLLSSVAHASGPAELMPGVTYEQQLVFTVDGPVRFNIVTVAKPGGLLQIVPTLAAGTITQGLSTLSQLEQNASSGATVAGINGDFFNGKTGQPAGIFLHGGVLEHGATAERSSIGIDGSGSLLVKRIAFAGTWKASGQRRPLTGLNQIPGNGQVSLFTPAWGPATPAVANSTEIVLEPFPPTTTDADLVGTVTAVASGSAVAIPPDGAVLMAEGSLGSSLPTLQDEAPTGTSVTIRLIMPTGWSNLAAAIGGGPLLVRNGQPVFNASENFDGSELAGRDARSAIGQLADGRLILVAADGNQPGFSVGLTSFALAQTMVKLGAVTAAGLGFGSDVAAAFNGQYLSRPSRNAQLKDALLVEYQGVYAPALTSPFVSRRTASSGQRFSYKIVRASTVTASVIDPGGVSHVVDSENRQPGSYSFTWSALGAEGTWHWNVKATDDLGRQSVADQPFTYDLTLGTLSAPRTESRTAGITIGAPLARPATLTMQIETTNGTILFVAPPLAEPMGIARLHWDATVAGALVPRGAYLARITAVSSIGTSWASVPFAIR
jgi:Phosphodiester glycosidase